MKKRKLNFVSITYDTTIKYLFKNDATRPWLEEIILDKCNINLKGYKLIDSELNTGSNLKDYRLDLLFQKGRNYVVLEMNNEYSKSSEIKDYQYMYRLEGNAFDKGEDYIKLRITKLIMINNYLCKTNKNIDKLNYKLMDEVHRVVKRDLEVHEIFLPYVYNLDYKSLSKIDKRLYLFCCKSFKEMRKVVDNEEDLKIVKELERLSKMDKFIVDYDHELVYKKTLNSMRIEGYETGKSEGYASGISDGYASGKIEVARKLLKKNIDIDTIAETTGLSKKKIYELKKS